MKYPYKKDWWETKDHKKIKINDMKPTIKVVLTVTLIFSYSINLIYMFRDKPLNILIANIIVWLLIIVILLGVVFEEWLKCRKRMLIENREKVVKGEKIYDVGDVVLYNRKKYKITYANWKIDEYRISEIENPNNYHFVVGRELKEVSE